MEDVADRAAKMLADPGKGAECLRNMVAKLRSVSPIRSAVREECPAVFSQLSPLDHFCPKAPARSSVLAPQMLVLGRIVDCSPFGATVRVRQAWRSASDAAPVISNHGMQHAGGESVGVDAVLHGSRILQRGALFIGGGHAAVLEEVVSKGDEVNATCYKLLCTVSLNLSRGLILTCIRTPRCLPSYWRCTTCGHGSRSA